ncbi:MAG: immunoglobulin domain-containing protein [Verrucomicrobia bacterium]|nr:immunoglobulin domain-containing protein [Verrucomicrobiota bacterium]
MRKHPNRETWVSRGFLGAALLGLASAQAQTVIPESVALPASALDKTKPGFSVRVFQATGPELPNTLVRTEDQIAGLLINPATGQPHANIADLSGFNPDGTYDEPATISYGAAFFPGIPGTEFTVNNIALEAITYVELNPGTYTMVVNSDDGFRVSTGNVMDRLAEIRLGEFDGGRGAGDTVFSFTVTKAGVYPFRLIYEQGGGGYSVNWYTAENGNPANRVLLNDLGGTPSYRALRPGAVTAGPAISAVSPLPNSLNVAPSAGITAIIKDGSTAFNAASFRLLRNGTDVTAQATIGPKSGNATKITYRPSTLPPALAVEEYTLVFDDPTATGGRREARMTYTVAPYANYNLPEPIWLETFDGIPEGTLPTGWTTVTPFFPGGFEDLDDPNSDSYLQWVVISRQRVVDIGAANRWDAGRRLNTPEAYINGQRVESLIQGQFAYHESDVRGGSQYAELFSPTINLSGKTDVHLVYHSIYEQNQDNIAGVEYSVDGGTTWLPVVYMLDVPDILTNPDGTVDVVRTFDTQYGDVARYTDPVTGEEVGGSYGAFVKAARSTWPNLGPYISGRINDNPTESKRIEKFRLPEADNKSAVKLRFFQAGTASWYFGVDNVGLYSITTIDPPSLTQQPANLTRIVGSPAIFEVGASGQQLSYQWQKGTEDIPGATAATLTIAAVKPADAGQYRCVITNPGGSVTSAYATLTVLQVPADAASLRNGLEVYLPFENNYNDASGNNRNGTPVGNPTFAAGKVGSAAVKVSSVRADNNYNFVTLGQNDSVPFGQTSDFTVAFWMKTERTAGDPSIVANKNWASGNNVGWTIGTQTDGRIEWNYRRTGADGLSRKDLDLIQRGNLLNTPNWVHVTVVWKINGDAETYFNGELVDARSIAPGTGDIFDSALSLNLGQDGTGSYGSGEWDGLLDEVAIWSRALTSDEVLTLYGFGLFGDSILAPPINSQLGAHLKFDGDFQDASGAGNHGTAVGAPTFTGGVSGQGVRLNTDKPNSVFNYVTLGNAPGVRFGETADFSVSFWAKLNGWNADPALLANKNWGSGNNVGWVIATDGDGRVQWNYRRRDPDSTRRDFDSVGGIFSDNAWHHVVVVFGINDQAVTYVDGLEVALDRNGAPARKDLTPSTGTLFDPALRLNIGQDGTGAYSDVDLFDAVMDEVALWNRKLSAREVALIYSRGLAGQSLDGTGTPPSEAPVMTYTVANGQLTLNWQGTGFTLQENSNLGNAAGWTAVAGAGANSATVPIATGIKFYRLVK